MIERTTIGPYRILGKLGRGGMAEVWLAVASGASGFERRVAIKLLAPEHLGAPDLERALIKEAVLGGSLHHRNLVAVLGLGVDDGTYYAVLEYLDGRDLASHLDAPHAPITAPLALHIVHELALGLAHLHAARDARGLPLELVHRDVGPANLLVSTSGDVKLGDFGLAKATAMADRTAAGTRKGRYSYMAPEQLRGDPVTAAADQFGLAVTLVELLTGARPFVGETPWALLDAIRAGLEPAVLATMPVDLHPLVTRALALDAAARYPSIDALRSDLAHAQRSREPSGPRDVAAWVRG